ncbi:cation:proton antiporter [[Clostridium] symbiosum]|uniref:cation:proton antiporter n=1 Tax=Clostridium symbiosum TaxID=1512 RepID=UPI00210DDFC5|nr:cation:proton antiporter [[Clostridium] symbiosum]MCQ4834448.1 cation:proton antiporter [[Clostridium] symbiosum]
MQEFLSQLNQETEALLVLSIILFAGFIMTRLTNTLNLPKVSGYILAGILIGPCSLNFIPQHMIDSMGFVSDLALAFIAFGVGKFFKKEVLMRTGKKIIVITISEALTAGVLVTVILKFIFRLDWDFALILGAIATATAPASTMMTINQYKAKGEFVNTLLQIVALDDVVCLLAFSIVAAIANGRASGALTVNDILIPVMLNLFAICLGFFCGYFLSRLLIPARSRDNRLILAIAMLLGLSGICAAADISPLLSCMVFGAAYINLTRDKKLFRQINNFTPPVMSIFFIVSGMNLNVNALGTVGVIGVAYFLIRIAGKYLGTYFSCLAMGTSREIRKYMGLALIPQAGVAIGLAFLGQRLLPPETGNLMLTIILSSSVLYEMVGPISAKAALFLSGSIAFKKTRDKEDTEPQCAASDRSSMCEKIDVITGLDSVIEEKEEGEEAEHGELVPEIPDSECGEESREECDEADDSSEDCECLSDEEDTEECEESGDHDDLADSVLEELREYSEGVDERDDYDIEKEVKPVKRKKKKKQNKKNK